MFALCYNSIHEASLTQLSWFQYLMQLLCIGYFHNSVWVALTLDEIAMVTKANEADSDKKVLLMRAVCLFRLQNYLVFIGTCVVILCQDTVVDMVKSIAGLTVVFNIGKAQFEIYKIA